VKVDFDPGWRRNIAPEQAALLDHLGGEITQDAQANAPVRTGALRDSLHHTVDGDTVHVGSDLDYAGFVEEGTRYMGAEPYLRPALYRERT
jgi:HK97 gp10 family phage protein